MTTPRRLFPRAAAAALGLAAVLAAPAAGATTSCSFSTIVTVAFGLYDTFSSSPLDTAGSISFSCQGVGSSDTIVIDLSVGGGMSYASRSLMSGSSVLTYNLFLDAARMSVWGDGSGGTSHYGPVTPTSGSTYTVHVYGQIPALQNVRSGVYADTVTATILF